MNRRQEQVADEIKQIVSVLLQREMKDPRLGFVTVISADVTQDLKYARIAVSVLGSPEEQKSSMDALASGRGFIRREVASRMHLRSVPEINFRLDRGAEYSDQINQLLNELKVADEEKAVDSLPGVTEESLPVEGDASVRRSESGEEA